MLDKTPLSALSGTLDVGKEPVERAPSGSYSPTVSLTARKIRKWVVHITLHCTVEAETLRRSHVDKCTWCLAFKVQYLVLRKCGPGAGEALKFHPPSHTEVVDHFMVCMKHFEFRSFIMIHWLE